MKTTASNPTSATLVKLNLLILAVCVAALLSGCGKDSGGTTAGGAQKKLQLAFVANDANEYWAMARLGCDFAARELGDVELEFRFPANRTAAAQQEILSALVARGVDGIAISPIDAEKQTDFLNTIAAKTLLVCADSDAESSQRTCYIGTDNVAAGSKAAEILKAALPQGGKVVLLIGYPDAQNTKDRIKGIQNGLAGSTIQIVETIADDHKSPIAQKNAQEALAKHPDLAGLIGIYSYHGPAILTVVRAADKAGKVKIVCFDEDSETLAGITSGDISGTIVQEPLSIGIQSILRMGKFLRGDKTQLAGGKIFTPSRALTTGEEIVVYQGLRKGLLQPAPTN